jgi:hypothetical protein
LTQHPKEIIKCNICQSKVQFAFKNKILNKYLINYYKCFKCGFLQTEPPYWLNEAYLESINLCDTGILHRNSVLTNFVSTLLFLHFPKNGKYLDYAGGYGIFTRAMRDIGFDFSWEDSFTKNIMAKGFEKKENSFDLITTIESFEHFENPIQQIEKILSSGKNLFFTTQLINSEIPSPKKWAYYGFNHGQHISFYSKETLEFIAKKFKLNLCSDGKLLHLLSFQKFPYNVIQESKFLYLFRFHHLVKKIMKSKTHSDSNRLIENS